ncbi:uncharacterized protein ColSpa_01884 [Colletotrichum spaethianum]|uniref:Uncharacterized protein n=1 Tax=Colletotrichum spaethianum TaxID=700344 RepID=A0AA37L8N6_9PEZI|nr:uncharacterized protein ColSpa_01884 [Colletotrichum spaethianum]GKT41703.1 hypothetical protein ColSpa_01884 [Colletotrichum spaethianum]
MPSVAPIIPSSSLSPTPSFGMAEPRVFKGREEEVTMEELANPGDAACRCTTYRHRAQEAQGRPSPKESRAAKKLKQAVNPEAAVESSQSVPTSAENSSALYDGTSESPSPTYRKTTRIGKNTKAMPNRELAPVAYMQPSARELIQNGTSTDLHEGNYDVKKDLAPEPVSVPKKRGRPRKTQIPTPVNTTDKGKSIEIRRRDASARLLILLAKQQVETDQYGLIDSVRAARVTTRNSLEKAPVPKTTPAKAAPAKKVFISQSST